MTQPTEASGVSSRLQPGTRVGRYRLLAPLASGGMAEVWAAKPEGNLGLSKTVAVKVVKGEFAADEEYTRMLIDEATVAASVHHPNVCELYELDKHDGILFMVMEWVAGDSLAGLLHKASTLAPLKHHLAARIVADSCAGTHAAHEAVDQDGHSLGIVHRDISPPNILLSLQGQVKVTDFGIAKARYQLHAKTRTGEIKGKFAYIPPEQIVGKGVDRRADVYALGCVLYVATLGLRPFGSGPRAMAKILAGEFKKPRELKPNYPEGLEAIILRALAREKEARFSTADEMRAAIEDWMVKNGTVVTAADIARVVRRRLNEEKRKAIEELRKLNRSSGVVRMMQDYEVPAAMEQTPTAASGMVGVPDNLRSSPDAADEQGAAEPTNLGRGAIRGRILPAAGSSPPGRELSSLPPGLGAPAATPHSGTANASGAANHIGSSGLMGPVDAARKKATLSPGSHPASATPAPIPVEVEASGDPRPSRIPGDVRLSPLAAALAGAVTMLLVVVLALLLRG